MPRKRTQEEFLQAAQKLHGSRYDYSEIEYSKAHTEVTIICRLHGPFTQTANQHLKGHGCNECAHSKVTRGRFNTASSQFVKRSKTVHGNKYDYSKAKYTGARERLEIVCRKHGSFWQRPNTHLFGSGCPKCYESQGEVAVRVFLEQHAIPFAPQARLIVGTQYRFDFYLPNSKTLIEYHGRQHFRALDFFGGVEGLKATQKRDQFKRSWAKQNGYTLVEIRYDEDVEEVLTATLLQKKVA